MRKQLLWICCLALLCLLTGCGKMPSKGTVTTNVTWDELLAANRLAAVLARGGFCSAAKDDDGTVYLSYAAMKDGELLYSTGTKEHTRDLRGGIIYNAWADEKDITIIASNADITELIEGAYIGGNGPIPGDMDVVQEIAVPDQVPAIQLTVVSPDGQKTYSVRKDAAISWKGEALYSDEACVNAVTDLIWVNSREAKVYVQ